MKILQYVRFESWIPGVKFVQVFGAICGQNFRKTFDFWQLPKLSKIMQLVQKSEKIDFTKFLTIVCLIPQNECSPCIRPWENISSVPDTIEIGWSIQVGISHNQIQWSPKHCQKCQRQ